MAEFDALDAAALGVPTGPIDPNALPLEDMSLPDGYRPPEPTDSVPPVQPQAAQIPGAPVVPATEMGAPPVPATPAADIPGATQKTADGQPAPAVVDPPSPPVMTDDVVSALRQAASAQGITEQDPLKIPGLLAARQQEQAEAAKVQRTQEALTQVRDNARTTTEAQLIQEVVMNQMREQFPHIAPEVWTDTQWWADPDAGPELERAFDAFRARASDTEYWQSRVGQAQTQATTAYETEEKAVQELPSRYEHMPRPWLTELRSRGVSAQAMDVLARDSHNATVAALSAQQGEVSRLKAENEQLTAQVSAFAAEREKASREGQNRALDIVAAGHNIGISAGAGGAAPGAQGDWTLDNRPNGPISIWDIPTLPGN